MIKVEAEEKEGWNVVNFVVQKWHEKRMGLTGKNERGGQIKTLFII